MARRRIETWRDPVTGRPKDPVPTPPSQLCAYVRPGTSAACGASKGLHRNITEGGDHDWVAPVSRVRHTITAEQAHRVRELVEAPDAAEAAEGLSAKDRDALASHECVLCGAALMALEVGRHYRLKHPNDIINLRPRR